MMDRDVNTRATRLNDLFNISPIPAAGILRMVDAVIVSFFSGRQLPHL